MSITTESPLNVSTTLSAAASLDTNTTGDRLYIIYGTNYYYYWYTYEYYVYCLITLSLLTLVFIIIKSSSSRRAATAHARANRNANIAVMNGQCSSQAATRNMQADELPPKYDDVIKQEQLFAATQNAATVPTVSNAVRETVSIV